MRDWWQEVRRAASWAVVLLTVVCAQGQPTQSEDAALVAELSGVYERWRRACVAGDVEQFLESRDSEEIARLVERIGRQLSSEDISAGAAWIPPIEDLRFIDLVQEGDWAQARYHGGDAEPDAAGERVRFHILLFHRQPDGWKLAVPGSVTHAKLTATGDEVTIQEVEIPDRMRLPSQRTGAAESEHGP